MTNSSAEDEEEDYLTMTFEEPAADRKQETLTQRNRRLARLAEERSRTKSKAQIAAEERAKRETALNQSSIDTSSKGFKMMQKLGYKPGTALGVDRQRSQTETLEIPDDHAKDDRLVEPIIPEMKEDRGGVGADAEKKRKFRAEVERIAGEEKKQRIDEGDFRERQVKEREEKRQGAQVLGAMKVAERLDEEDRKSIDGAGMAKSSQHELLKNVNPLWRGLVKERMILERDKRMRYDLHQSLSRLPTYDDRDEEKDDRIAMSRKEKLEEIDLELDQDDDELEEFESLPVNERLEKLVRYLRERWRYCFWCKYRYADASMDGCPGVTEDDHD